MRQTRWLPAVLWPVGIAAVAAGFALLFTGEGDVTPVAVISRSVGGSFIVCGLFAWHRRPDSRTGPLMTLTGSLFLLAVLAGDLDFTLGEVVASWWAIAFAALVLGVPGGRIRSRIDWLIIGGFAFGSVVVQVVWLFFRPVPEGGENWLLITPDAEFADAIDAFQHGWIATMAIALAIVGLSVWLRAARPLRRLLLPKLAGALAALILGLQGYYQVFAGEFIDPGQQVTAVVLVSVPLAFIFSVLQTELARAGMADLVVTLRQARDSSRLGERLAIALDDPSLELVYWLPGFETYVDAGGNPVMLPVKGSGRAATTIEHDGVRVAALVHDAALSYEPRQLEIVCAATDVALERRRLQEELESRVEELAGSRVRLVEAGDEARRRIERDLHDGAQQRLVSLGIDLALAEGRIRDDPETATGLLAAARNEVSASLKDLRELARGIHPAVLEQGLKAALGSLATRSQIPVSVSVDLEQRLPGAIEMAAYFVACEGLANVGKYAQASEAAIRVSRGNGVAVIEVSDDGIGGADGALGSGLRGLADRVGALGGSLRVASPAGGGTVLTAEMPCEDRHVEGSPTTDL